MRRFILFLFTLLGFGAVATSCSEGSTNDLPAPEYGCPWVEFSIKARVVDAEGKPISGIEVKSGYDVEELDLFKYLGLTNSEGNLSVDDEATGLPGYLLLTDTDGEANGGEFEDKVVAIEDKFEQVKEGESWYRGGYKAELGDITLDKR